MLNYNIRIRLPDPDIFKPRLIILCGIIASENTGPALIFHTVTRLNAETSAVIFENPSLTDTDIVDGIRESCGTVLSVFRTFHGIFINILILTHNRTSTHFA
ncbi:hypothetical protein QUF75_19920 [Desulfococcaceae bacterium HSG7]|nr:hypothetical protein [Desulfococcaceae bacterium HSG7]